MKKSKHKPKDISTEDKADTQVEVKNETSEETTDKKVDHKEAETKQLTKEEELALKIEELEGKFLRKVAEFENFKKRTARQFDDMAQAGTERVIGDLLDVVDNFNRSLEHKDNGDGFEAFKQGIELIYNQMTALLEKYNVTPIEAVGQKFDPNYHEALMQLESEEYDADVVAMEISRGYTMGEKVIRHSKVGVSSKKKNDTDKTENDGDNNKE